MSGRVEFRGTARFEVECCLGTGGMGVVYRAFDRERKMRVALKTLKKLDEHSLYRFKNEFRALADLNHPNLVGLGELYFEAGEWFFTMELIEGVSFLSHVWRLAPGERLPLPDPLAPDDDTPRESMTAPLPRVRRARPCGRLDRERLRSALAQLVSGLQALHAAGKVHRDIKPSNIMVTSKGRVVLLDFGLVADVRDGQQSSADRMVGTAVYMAPEQGTGQPVGPAADWYAVGVVLYEALTGQVPFEGSAIDVLVAKQGSDPLPPSALDGNVPRDLEALCMALLQRRPADRSTPEQVMAALGLNQDHAPARPSVGPPSSPVPDVAFVGREHELTMLREAWSASGEGHAVTMFVHGESGLGKSALVRQFADELLEGSRAVVLAGRCYERESVPFKAFDGIIDALSRHLGRLDPVDAALLLPDDAPLLARVFPVLRRAEVVARAPESRYEIPNPQELRTRAFAALRRLLSRLADRQRLMLYIDDFQWADADSLGLLTDVMHPPNSPALFLVATVRSSADAQTPVQRALSGMSGALGDVRFLELGPLAPESARALATLLMGPARPGVDAAALAAEAGGHPLFIQELVRHVQQGGAQLTQVRLDEALWARISQEPLPARTLLEVVVLAGVPIAQRLVLQAAGLEPAEGAHWMQTLRRENFARTSGARYSDIIEPYHDRVREAVLARLDDDTRRRHHARLADALEAAGVGEQDAQSLVRHLEAAGETVRAARQAERAARVAREALAFDQAAGLYRTVLRLGAPAGAERRKLLMELGDALVHAGRGAEAADAYLGAVEGADSADRLECQRRAAEQLLISGHIERGLETVAAVLVEVGERLPATPKRALISLLWQRTKLRLRGFRRVEHDESEIAARDLMKLDVYRAVALGLGMVDNIRAADFQSRGLLLALRTGERRRICRSIANEAMHLSSQGARGRSRARRLAQEARQVASQTGDPYLVAWTAAAGGIASYFAGAFPAAETDLWEAEKRFRDETTGTAWELSNVRLFRMFTLRHMGRWADLGRAFDDYVHDASRRGDRFAETTMTRAFNCVWLARDSVEQALRELDRKSWSPPKGGYHLQHWFELRARVELDLYRGEGASTMERLRAGFVALQRSLILRAQLTRADACSLRGRVALAQAEAGVGHVQALAEAARMARRLEREGVVFADIWAHLLRAGLAAQANDSDGLLRHLDAVVAAAVEPQMALCSAVARRRRGEWIGGENGAALIDEADRWMAAEGIRNPAGICEAIAPGFDTVYDE